MEELLCEITGMDGFTMQPPGAHGELAGTMLIAAYHNAKRIKEIHNSP